MKWELRDITDYIEYLREFYRTLCLSELDILQKA